MLPQVARPMGSWMGHIRNLNLSDLFLDICHFYMKALLNEELSEIFSDFFDFYMLLAEWWIFALIFCRTLNFEWWIAVLLSVAVSKSTLLLLLTSVNVNFKEFFSKAIFSGHYRWTEKSFVFVFWIAASNCQVKPVLEKNKNFFEIVLANAFFIDFRKCISW